MHANYRQINPPDDTAKEDYTPGERRAEIFDLIEQAGHYRNLQRSYRQLGNQYGVTKQQIRKDIVRVLEWKADNLSPHAEAELETLKTKAIQTKLDENKPGEAYDIMSKHLENLQTLGEIQREPEKHEVEFDGPIFGSKE